MAGADEDDPGVFEAQRRKLGFVWIASSSKEDGEEGDEEEEMPSIQPIPSKTQLFLGHNGEEVASY